MRYTLARWPLGQWQPGNSVLTARLLDAVALPGCPLCRVEAATTQHHLEALLDERVTLPEAHQQLLASRGFCAAHTWALLPAALAAQSARGIALLYAPLLNDLLRHWLDPIRRRSWLLPERPCPVCQILARTVPAYRTELTYLLQQSGEPPTSALCLPHLASVNSHTNPQIGAQLTTVAAQIRQSSTPAECLALLVGARPTQPFPADQTCPACAAATEAAHATRTVTGICSYHAWANFTSGRADFVEAIAAASDTAAGCPACRAANAAVGVVLATRQPAHRLCLGHLRQSLTTEWLDTEIAFWSLIQLQRDVTRFIEGGRATFVGTLTPDERRSWHTALRRFGGEAPGTGLTPPGVGRHLFRWRALQRGS